LRALADDIVAENSLLRRKFHCFGLGSRITAANSAKAFTSTTCRIPPRIKSQKSRAERAQRPMKEAVEKSGRDNTTALAVEIA
jgi:hypothetical protein